MFYTNLFWFEGCYGTCYVLEISFQKSLVVNRLLREEGFCWQLYWIFAFDVYCNENRMRTVIGKQLINFNIVTLESVTCYIPSKNLFLDVNFLEHLEHFFGVIMVHKPDTLFLRIFIKRKRVRISHFVNSINILSQ